MLGTGKFTILIAVLWFKPEIKIEYGAGKYVYVKNQLATKSVRS